MLPSVKLAFMVSDLCRQSSWSLAMGPNPMTVWLSLWLPFCLVSASSRAWAGEVDVGEAHGVLSAGAGEVDPVGAAVTRSYHRPVARHLGV